MPVPTSLAKLHRPRTFPLVATAGQAVFMPLEIRLTSCALALQRMHALPRVQVAPDEVRESGPSFVKALICPVKRGSVKVEAKRCGMRGSYRLPGFIGLQALGAVPWGTSPESSKIESVSDCWAVNSPDVAPWLMTLSRTSLSVSGSGARKESTHVLHASRMAWVGMLFQVSWPVTWPNALLMPEPPHAIQSARAFERSAPKATTYVVTEAAGSPVIVPSAFTVPAPVPLAARIVQLLGRRGGAQGRRVVPVGDADVGGAGGHAEGERRAVLVPVRDQDEDRLLLRAQVVLDGIEGRLGGDLAGVPEAGEERPHVVGRLRERGVAARDHAAGARGWR